MLVNVPLEMVNVLSANEVSGIMVCVTLQRVNNHDFLPTKYLSTLLANVGLWLWQYRAVWIQCSEVHTKNANSISFISNIRGKSVFLCARFLENLEA